METERTSETEAVEKEAEVAERQAIGEGTGLIRTFLIFLDVPFHYEFRAHPMPLMPHGVEMEFRLSLRNPKDPKKVRVIEGPYVVRRRKLIYSTQKASVAGLSQYLELEPVPQRKS